MGKRKIVHVGISFSGGGSRGLAHIGVMKALSEAGVKPEIFSGASMGSMIGALFANGYSADEAMEIATEQKKARLFEWNNLKLGITSQGPVRKILSEVLPETFEELKYPLFISTTNLNTAKNVMFSRGALIDPVLASMSIPVVFKPITINEDLYVDGGLTENLPAYVLRDKCKVLAGSHVNHIDENRNLKNIKAIAERCFRIAIYKSVLDDKELCDFFVDPPEVRKYETLNFKHIPEVIDIGYQATRRELEKNPGIFEKEGIMGKLKQLVKR